MRYCFIGDAELVTAFSFVGIEGIVATTGEEVLSAFLRVTRGWVAGANASLPGADAYRGEGETAEGDCKVLILTEDAADFLGDTLVEWQMSARYPLVVLVPPLSGRRPGRPTLVDTIRAAIGVQI